MFKKLFMLFVLGTLCLTATACARRRTTNVSPLAPRTLEEVLVGRVSPREAYQIATQAYIYAYPIVRAAARYNNFFFEPAHPMFKAPAGHIWRETAQATPETRTVAYPDRDLIHAYAFVDLRREPIIVTIPEFEATRYFSLEVKDLYTHIAGFAGRREDGFAGYNVLITGPRHRVLTLPAGVVKTINVETDFAFLTFRTQVLSRPDLSRAVELQEQYALAPLSAFLGTIPPPLFQGAHFPRINERRIRDNMFEYLAALLPFLPAVDDDEQDLRESFALIGITEGSFSTEDLPVAVRSSIASAKLSADRTIASSAANITDFSRFFGPRAMFMPNNLLNRAAISRLNFQGTQREEISAVLFTTGPEGQRLNAATGDYRLTFARGQFPRTQSFWSVTVYTRDSFLFENAINRHSITSRDIRYMAQNPDGSVTIDLAPTARAGRQRNWLPVPNDEFVVMLRNYIPFEGADIAPAQLPELTKVRQPAQPVRPPAPVTVIRDDIK